MRQKPTIRELILARFKTRFKEGFNGFVNAQKIEDIIHAKTGHKHETIGRELRRMAEDKLLEVNEERLEGDRVNSRYYKYIPSKNEVASFIMMQRLKINN